MESTASARVDAVIADTEMTGNYTSVTASRLQTGGPINILATRSTISMGVGIAFAATTALSTISVDACAISAISSANPVFFAADGGIVYSRGNNTIAGTTNFGSSTTLAGH